MVLDPGDPEAQAETQEQVWRAGQDMMPWSAGSTAGTGSQ
jgi:hypothetical protein